MYITFQLRISFFFFKAGVKTYMLSESMLFKLLCGLMLLELQNYARDLFFVFFFFVGVVDGVQKCLSSIQNRD